MMNNFHQNWMNHLLLSADDSLYIPTPDQYLSMKVPRPLSIELEVSRE